jgi:hypothetical protein
MDVGALPRCARVRGAARRAPRNRVSVRIRGRYEGDESVTCVIPGHERPGEELISDELVVEDDQLSFEYRGVCGYASTFDYAG